MKLNPKSLGLAGGILWGAALLLMTLLCLQTGYASELLNSLTKLYPGYQISLPGSIVGFIYGFLDAFIGFYVFAWLYNKFEKN